MGAPIQEGLLVTQRDEDQDSNRRSAERKGLGFHKRDEGRGGDCLGRCFLGFQFEIQEVLLAEKGEGFVGRRDRVRSSPWEAPVGRLPPRRGSNTKRNKNATHTRSTTTSLLLMKFEIDFINLYSHTHCKDTVIQPTNLRG